jgi:hypothetical protein
MRDKNRPYYRRFPLNIDILFERVLAIVGIATLIWFMVRA